MSLGPSNFEEAKRAWKKQDEWRRCSVEKYEDRLREESDSKYRDIGRNDERQRERRERDFGLKAEFIRCQPCDACGAPPPSDPDHHPTRAAGGTKENLWPLCHPCHVERHSVGIETFCERHGVDATERTEHWEDEWQRRTAA